jgi:hypothetical protein
MQMHYGVVFKQIMDHKKGDDQLEINNIFNDYSNKSITIIKDDDTTSEDDNDVNDTIDGDTNELVAVYTGKKNIATASTNKRTRPNDDFNEQIKKKLKIENIDDLQYLNEKELYEITSEFPLQMKIEVRKLFRK